MREFRIIPVIDIKNSIVVHAIKGERAKYCPLKSQLISTHDPLELALFFKNQMGFSELYIADLDGIINKKPNIKIISKILNNSNIKLMLDPGISEIKDFSIYLNLNLNKIILGIETIKNLKIIENALDELSNSKIIISIDMYKGIILSKSDIISKLNPIDLVRDLNEIGVNEIILLDLFRVGQKCGGIPQLFLKIRDNFNGDILIGGGIKNIQDIELIYRNNFSGVLIATALHDGSINKNDIIQFKARIT
ncbi:MAG: HisA/HisF-related TIM barrel protein [Promethearchaeota archaeon]